MSASTPPIRALDTELATAPPDAVDALATRRRQLAVDYRGRRWPFLRAAGLHLRAVMSDDDRARRRDLNDAIALLTPLEGSIDGGLRQTVRRHLALAHLELGEIDEAAALIARARDDASRDPEFVFDLTLDLTAAYMAHQRDGLAGGSPHPGGRHADNARLRARSTRR